MFDLLTNGSKSTVARIEEACLDGGEVGVVAIGGGGVGGKVHELEQEPSKRFLACRGEGILEEGHAERGPEDWGVNHAENDTLEQLTAVNLGKVGVLLKVLEDWYNMIVDEGDGEGKPNCVLKSVLALWT